MTTTTTTVAAKHGVGGFTGGFPLPLLGVALLFLIVMVFVAIRPGEKISGRLGGKVVGIVGRMGSGKTYMAVMIAYQHLLAGHDVRTNFTMVLPKKFYRARISTTGVQTAGAREELKNARKEGRQAHSLWFDCLPRASVPWEYFTGWEQFAELDNCVVVIDESQLYAPSYKPLAFPLIARWKLAMARKFKLDVYWVSQHEDRVNATLKHLTNIIYVCNAWFGSRWFSAKGYEPEYVRRVKKHIARKSYKFKLANAQLYDTLEIITPDEHLGDEKVLANLAGIHGIAEKYQGRRPGDYGPCVGTTQKGSPCSRRAASETGLCGQHEKSGQTIEEVLMAAEQAGLDTGDDKPVPKRHNTFSLTKHCYGMNASGTTCHAPTTNANGLCDECIRRARLTLVKT